MGGASTGGTPQGSSRYVHDALFYGSPEELVAVAVPFLLEGLAAGDAAVVSARSATTALLREAVDGDPRVEVLGGGDVYGARTPEAVVALRRLAGARVAGGACRVRVVGEVDFGTTPREQLEWQRYEGVVNHVLAAWPLWGLCVFDTRRLPDPVLESACRSHPTVVSGGGRRPNPRFADPARYLRELPVPPEPLEDTAPRLAIPGVTDLAPLRQAVAAELAAVGGPADLAEDFLLAVYEVASNALRHGRSPVDVRLWTSGDTAVCRVTDRGTWEDPFAGYAPTEDPSRGGMGLWLARRLCDHVDVARTGEGASVRLTTRLR